MATKTTKSKANTNPFTITVKIDSATYEGTGATALEALRAIPSPSLDLIGAGSVFISHDGKSKEMFFPQQQLKRLLNPYNMEVLVNDLTQGL